MAGGIKTRVVLGSVNWVAGGVDQVYFRGLPTKGLGGNRVARLTELEFELNLAVTTDSGGSVTSQKLHQLVTYNSDDGSSPWGPVQQVGDRLSALYFLQTGTPIPFAESANGDTDVAASQTAASRIFRELYSFEKFGTEDEPSLFCPPCSALKGGSVQFTFGALPTNATAITGTITVYAHIMWVNIEDAVSVTVPRIRTVSQAFVGTGMDLTIAGLALRMFAYNSSTAVALTDWTTFQIYADGFPIVLDHNPVGRRSTAYNETSGVTSSALQSTFADSIGGPNANAMPLFPVDPRQHPEECPSADTFNLQFTGAADTTKWTMIMTYVVELSDADVTQQSNACGCDDAVRGTVSVPVIGRKPLPIGSHVAGFTPIAHVPPGAPIAKGHTLIHRSPPALSINGIRHAIGSSVKGGFNTLGDLATAPGATIANATKGVSIKSIEKRLGF